MARWDWKAIDEFVIDNPGFTTRDLGEVAHRLGSDVLAAMRSSGRYQVISIGYAPRTSSYGKSPRMFRVVKLTKRDESFKMYYSKQECRNALETLAVIAVSVLQEREVNGVDTMAGDIRTGHIPGAIAAVFSEFEKKMKKVGMFSFSESPDVLPVEDPREATRR